MKTLTSVLISALIFCILSLAPAQQNKSKKEIPIKKESAFLISGNSIMAPLMRLWLDACPQQIESPNVLFQYSHDLSLDDALQKEGADMFMFSGLEQDLPEDAGLWQMKVAREAVVPVYNSGNPMAARIREKGLSPDQLIKLFTSNQATSWGSILDNDDPSPVHVYILEPHDGASQVWANFLFTKADQLKGKIIAGDEEMIAALRNDPLAIGFCNLKYAYDLPTGDPAERIGILPIDLNVNHRIDYTERIPDKLKDMQRVIWLGSYPSNLCRPLSLIATQKPNNEKLLRFLSWILNEGQLLACDNGYCRLRKSELTIQQNCLSQE
jgi:phosphate transport system substrate-binding protein